MISFAASGAAAQSKVQRPSADEALLKACEESLACSSHLSRANQLYEKDSYAAALDEYQAAYILQPYPLILYNIGRIHHKMGQMFEAMTYYQRYLDTGHGERKKRAVELLTQAQKELDAMAEPAPPPLASEREIEPPPAPLIVAPAAAAASDPRPGAQSAAKPVYKKWWFWTVIGVAAAGAATAAGIGIYARGPDVSGVPEMTLSF